MGKIASFWLTFFVYREILGAFQREIHGKDFYKEACRRHFRERLNKDFLQVQIYAIFGLWITYSATMYENTK